MLPREDLGIAVERLCGLRKIQPGLKPRERLRYSFRYSLSRRVWVRLTGISVAFASFIRRM